MNADRYARQVQVPGVGEGGQARIRAARVRVFGDGVASEVCARYLVGAGVRTVELSPRLVERCGSINTEVVLQSAPAEGSFGVELGGRSFARLGGADDGSVELGARGARWALALILSGGDGC